MLWNSGEDVQQGIERWDLELEGRNSGHKFGCHLHIIVDKTLSLQEMTDVTCVSQVWSLGHASVNRTVRGR